MYVSNLKLKNVRQFDDRPFDFKPGFNLLVGENGAGKTTILKAIYAALSKRSYAFGQSVIDDDDIRLHQSDLCISAVISDTRGKQLGTSIYERSLGAHTKRPPCQCKPLVIWYLANEATCNNLKGRRIYKRPSPSLKERIRDLEHQLYLYNESPLQGTSENKTQTLFGRSEDVNQFVSKILCTFSPLFKSFIWNFEPYGCSLRAKDKEESHKLLFQRQRRMLADVIMRHLQEAGNPLRMLDKTSVKIDALGHIVGSVADRPVTPPFEELCFRHKIDWPKDDYLENYVAEIRLTPRIRILNSQNDGLFLHQLSDGEQRLFSLFVDIARQLLLAHQNSAVVLIDEIDVHLHPKWQRLVVSALKNLFPGCQFIATTHSPFVIQSLCSGELQRLDASRKGEYADKSIEDIAEAIMGIDMPQKSDRYQKMVNAAEKYFRCLQTTYANSQSIRDAEQELNKLSEPFSDDPAFQALLNLERETAMGGAK